MKRRLGNLKEPRPDEGLRSITSGLPLETEQERRQGHWMKHEAVMSALAKWLLSPADR